MIWIYRLVFLPTLLFALPYYFLRMWRRGGYRKDFKHRFGLFPALAPVEEGKKRIWLQAVSVGEILAIGPLIDALLASGKIEIVITTTTSTGYAEARKRYADKALSLGIFPLDFWLCSRLAWKRIRADAIILTESELWPEHLHQAVKRSAPAYLVNARISDRSFERYQKVPTLASSLLRKLDAIYAASALDQSRVIKIGANPQKVMAHGSIKFDVPPSTQLSAADKNQLRAELGFGPENGTQPLIILGSSTWPGEEATLLAIHKGLVNDGLDCRLLLVPRHAERAPDIVHLLEQQNLAWQQRSKLKTATSPNKIYLADTTGELSYLSQIADVAFIGKSLPPNEGGQTPIEAAGLGIPILMGPNMNNFKDVARSLLQYGVACKVENSIALKMKIEALLANPEKRDAMSRAGLEWHRHNRGSSERIAVDILNRLS